MRGHVAVDAIERVGGDAAAIAQPRRELAVVDGAAAERRLGKPGLPTIIRDFLQEFLSVHPALEGLRHSSAWRRLFHEANQDSPGASTTK